MGGGSPVPTHSPKQVYGPKGSAPTPGAVTLNQSGTFSASVSPLGINLLGVGEMLWSGESLRFLLPRFPHPPPQAPGSPGACWEPRPGLWARLLEGGEPPFPFLPTLA